MAKWWQTANIYQVYLRSFLDSDQNGIGDINGVIAKLPYFKELGIGILWISPHYDSPMDDNGYDVRDFYRVSPDYGTLDNFIRLIQEAHKMGIRIITDLILNHTSDEHPWFVAASDPTHPDHAKYHDYFIWQKPKYDALGNRMRPTRWMAWFGCPAWDYNPATDEYYLHIFSKKMPDLNWRNAQMRADMKAMIAWWVNIGVDGFRVDASNHLEKNWEFPDTFPGYENFSSIPKHHEYLRELGEEIFVPHDVLTIGESGGASREEALKYAGFGSNEFNMLIQFGHCWADIDNHHPKLMGKWAQGTLEVSKIKISFAEWYGMLEDKGWNVIYWHNHDQPRVVSHYGNDRLYHHESATMLAAALYFMPGTAIVYQGEEIGMTNVKYEDIHQFRDVEVFTEYQNFLDRGYEPAAALDIIKARSRDNARTPMQWDASENGGFSKSTPWIAANSNFDVINVSAQSSDPKSILSTYRTFLNLRKNDPNIAFGKLQFIDIRSDNDYCYLNRGETSDYLVLCNFTAKTISKQLSLPNLDKFSLIYGNRHSHSELHETMTLEPYEAFVFVRHHS